MKYFFPILFITSFVFADTPSDVVQKAFEALKSSGEFSSLEPYLDWQTMYERIDPKMKEKLQLRSIEELKSYSLAMMKDPKRAIQEMMNKFVPAGTKIDDKMIPVITQMVEAKMLQVKEQLRTLVYRIGKESIEGDLANVQVTVSEAGKDRDYTVKLKNRAEKGWLISDFGSLVADPGKPAPAM